MGMGMGQSGGLSCQEGLAVPGGLLGEMPIYILKKIIHAGNHPGERNRAGARCALCPHLAPRSESSQGQSNPIPAPGAALGPGSCQEHPGKAQHRLQPWRPAGWLPARAAAELAVLCCAALCCSRGQAVQGQGAPACGHCRPGAGAAWHRPHAGCRRAGGPGWQGGDLLGAGSVPAGPSFVVLEEKERGEGTCRELGWAANRLRGPLPPHSTPVPLHSTFIEDATAARVAVPGARPEPGGAAGPGGQAEVVVLGGTGVPPVRPAGSTGLGPPLVAMLIPILCGSINKYRRLRVPELSRVLPRPGHRLGGPRVPGGQRGEAGAHTRLLARRSRRSSSLTTSAP